MSRGKHFFITTFMKHIQLCILTRDEKENSSQTYQVRALTVFKYHNFQSVLYCRHSDARNISQREM